MAKKKKHDQVDFYDDIMSALEASRQGDNIEVFRASGSTRSSRFNENDPDTEMFVTIGELAKEEEERKAPKSGRGRSKTLAPGQIEESVYFKYDDYVGPKFTDEQLAEFREGCKLVVVHDYSEKDFYHISDEERSRLDQLDTIRQRLGSLKRIYRSVDLYIEAMRTVYEAWSILAERNHLHTREEFFELVGKGRILSGRIIIPKLKGVDDYNKDLIIKYIGNPELDPKDLVPKSYMDIDEYFGGDDIDIEAKMDMVIADDELAYLVKAEQDPNFVSPVKVKPIDKKFLKGYDDSLNRRRRKRKSRKLKKVDKLVQDTTNTILKKIQQNNYSSESYGYSFGLLENFFKEKKSKSIYDKVHFDGSWQNDEHVELYELALEEEKLNERSFQDSYLTAGDYKMNDFFRKLEEHGVNTIELRRRMDGTTDKYLAERKRQSRRENKKMESKIIQRVQALSENPKYQKLIKKSEKAIEDFRKERKIYGDDDYDSPR